MSDNQQPVDELDEILNEMAIDLAVRDERLFEAEKRAKAKLQKLIDQAHTKGREEGYKKGYIDAGLEQINKGVDNG